MVSRSRRRPVPALVLSLALSGCSPSEPTGRDWVNTGNSRQHPLFNGVLHVDQRFPEVVQTNYQGFLGIVSKVFQDRHLFNPGPVPLVVYLMRDGEQVARYCRLPLDGRGVFVPEEGSIYAHASGRPLVDGGTTRALIRDVARAVLQEVYYRDTPPWLELGAAELFAGGAFGPAREQAGREPGFEWFPGLPSLDRWRPVLGAAPLPGFDAVRKATAAELQKLGPGGAAVAVAAVYLLKQLDKLEHVIYQIRPAVVKERDPESVLEVIRKNVPRYDALFTDPVGSLFKLRPDYKAFLECELLGATSATLERSLQNADANPHVGGYWWQCARFALALGLQARAREALDKCLGCGTHPDRQAALAALAEIHYAARSWPELEPVVIEQLRGSPLPTPTMHMMLAEAALKSKPEQARKAVEQGLALPAAGFEKAVARLRELRKEVAN